MENKWLFRKKCIFAELSKNDIEIPRENIDIIIRSIL